MVQILVFILLFTSNLLAGVTGKISGKVSDQSTGEPLHGANVVIDGTTMGASTDVEGFYFIINENRVTIPINFRLNVYESTL
ncbi:MAG: carboxypeptidase-like regulatory domain-containing protein [Candidatus Marinimicrobia bacterium]|nr:carboxypeptidase-like regulatory domain-containing protein [Candidatus Neomarinimicrobiota bacterium]